MYVSSNLTTKTSTRIIFFSNNSEGSSVPSNSPLENPSPGKFPPRKFLPVIFPPTSLMVLGGGMREDC